MMWYDDGGSHMGTGGWFVMGFSFLLFWAFVAALVVWVLRNTRSVDPDKSATSSPHRSPDEVLAERFARGEIDVEEFQRRRDVLRQVSYDGSTLSGKKS